MADRYWVGGSGNWNDTAHWSTASGGGSGASVPTNADNVFFDNSSGGGGVFTVTLNISGATCANFDASGITNAANKMTLTGTNSVGQLQVNGNWTNPTSTYFAWTTWTAGIVTFAASGTVTTNAVAFTASFVINGAGITITLGGALTFAAFLTLTNGSFDTDSVNNYAVTGSGTASFGITFTANSNTRSLNLNGSTVSIAGSLAYIDSSTGGTTLNAGTSSITCSNASPLFFGNGATFNNVTFSSAAAGTITITGQNTFSGTLSFTSRSATGVKLITFGASQTIGTLTLGAANTAIRRILCFSDTVGTQRTLTVTTFSATTNVDFRDIQAAGSSVSGSNWNSAATGRFGDCGGNGNKITFDAAKIVYWNLAGTQNWSATGWATTNNGSPAANNFPLAQDTATFTEAGSAGTVTVDINWNIGAIQMADGVSNRTTAMTLATGTTTPTIYKSVTFFSSLTLSGTGALTFAGQGTTQTITPAGIAFTQPLTINSPAGTVALAANTTVGSTLTTTLTAGNLDLTNAGAGNYTLSTGLFSSSGSGTRQIAFGSSGAITLTGSGTVWTTSTATNFSYTGTSKVNVSNNSATATTVTTGAHTEAQALNFNYTVGTYTLTDTAAVYKNLDFTGFTGTVPNSVRTIYGSVTYVSGPTYTAGANATTFAATSGTQALNTYSGLTLDFPITQNNPGATLQLDGTYGLTMGATRTFTLTAGTLNLNTKTATINTFSSTGSTVRAINFNSGTLSISGTTTSAFTASGSNLTTTGTGTITMTAATAKTFAGGGFSYSATLNQGGAGALTVTGSNTFYDITATTLPSTITFTAGTTQTVTQFTASGTLGNLLTLNSSTPGSAFTLTDASGTNTVSYCSITNSTATGGATWSSLLTDGNVNGGGNSGWMFNLPVVYSYSSDIKLRSMAQRGRF